MISSDTGLFRKEITILVVDDNECDLEIATRIIHDLGFLAVQAHSTLEGIHAAGVEQINMAIIDIDCGIVKGNALGEFLERNSIPYFYWTGSQIDYAKSIVGLAADIIIKGQDLRAQIIRKLREGGYEKDFESSTSSIAAYA